MFVIIFRVGQRPSQDTRGPPSGPHKTHGVDPAALTGHTGSTQRPSQDTGGPSSGPVTPHFLKQKYENLNVFYDFGGWAWAPITSDLPEKPWT